MIAISSLSIGGIVVAVLIVLILLVMLKNMVNIVQQGEVGVVKRLGEYRKTHEPGLVIIAPFIDGLQRVDMREIPVPGDRQEVITRDNVVVTVAEHGNTSAASIPLALDTAVRDGRIKPGQNILMEAVGGGFTWGAVLIRW